MGVRGETSGEPWRRWGRVPPWCPPAWKMSRPKAVRCRGGWTGAFWLVGSRKGFGSSPAWRRHLECFCRARRRGGLVRDRGRVALLL
jgi:hypothetical protein